jgi:aspartyl-tRNA(Asn)/glutamyl-tRNA(Gln) amidotransferase subunit C
MITKEDVQKLATLSRLTLSDEEMTRFQGEMSSILAYVDKLKEVTDSGSGLGSGPVMSVNRNVLREDANPNEGGAYTRALVDGAPQHLGDLVKVKKILS